MFTARLGTAGVLLAVFVSALFFLPNAAWTALIVLALGAASWEWATLCGMRSTARGLYAGGLPASAVAIWMSTGAGAGIEGHPLLVGIYFAACAFWLLVALPWLTQRWDTRSAVALGTTGWFVLVPPCLALSQLQSEPQRLLAILAVIWLADSAAYLVGKRWGRRKLAPQISPGKTWEGVAGAAVAVAVYYWVLSITVPQWGWWQGPWGVVMFTGVAVMGVVGDLFESWMKRLARVKDSGSLLPGHGGVLDRVDSLASSLPLAALLLPYAG